MPDILLAISKSLASVPGLGPVFNPIISIWEGNKAEAANAALLQKLDQGHEISRQAMDEILIELSDARQENLLVREQIVTGFYAILKLAYKDIMDSNGARPNLLLSGSTHEVQERVSSLIHKNGPLLASEGLVTQEAVRDELVHLFSDDVRTLLALAQPAGFPKGWVPAGVAPIQAYYLFLETLEGLPNEQRARVARAVARKKRGSEVLDKWAALYGSLAQELNP